VIFPRQELISISRGGITVTILISDWPYLWIQTAGPISTPFQRLQNFCRWKTEDTANMITSYIPGRNLFRNSTVVRRSKRTITFILKSIIDNWKWTWHIHMCIILRKSFIIFLLIVNVFTRIFDINTSVKWRNGFHLMEPFLHLRKTCLRRKFMFYMNNTNA